MPKTKVPVAPAIPPFLWHNKTIDECKAAAESLDVDHGLTTAEADKRILEQGRNVLAPPERPSFIRKLWAQINSALIWILIATIIISETRTELPLLARSDSLHPPRVSRPQAGRSKNGPSLL